MNASQTISSLNANYAPFTHEVNFEDLDVVEGCLSAELSGTLYRNGPNPQPPQLAGDDWIATLMSDAMRATRVDARDVSMTSLARVELPILTPHGFHGTWRNNDRWR